MTTAYRRYLIRSNPLNGLMWIEKDSVHIAFVTSVEQGKQVIDMLLD